jgi:hypothetical protein
MDLRSLLRATGLARFAQSGSQEYRSLQNEDKAEPDGSRAPSQADDDLHYRAPSRKKTSLLLKLLVTALSISLVIISVLYLQLHALTIRPPRLDCGESVEEAVHKGCTFDQLIKTWLPQDCPRYGLEEHLSVAAVAENETGGRWRYYRDREGAREVSITELARSMYSSLSLFVCHSSRILFFP